MIRLALILLIVFAGTANAADLPDPVSDSDFRTYSEAQVKLGRLLFYDRILSGSMLVSCGTCHNHDRATSNGPRIDGALVEGDAMAVDNLAQYLADNPSARHAPPLFNLGAKEFTTLFGNGRVSVGIDGGFAVPDGVTLPDGLRDVLAVQALLPAVTPGELATHGAGLDHDGLWREQVERVQAIAAYEVPFTAAFPEIVWPSGVSVSNMANSISAFVGSEWRTTNAPFDRFLRGETDALDANERRGMGLFYGKANCATCHSGPFQTDHTFYVVATPALPLDTDLTDGLPDYPLGRFDVTDDEDDRYAVRTPPLRNIAVTAPYGREGAYETLVGYMRHHLDPLPTMRTWFRARTATRLPDDVAETIFQLSSRNTLESVDLSEKEFTDLLAFLGALTDETGLMGRLGKPLEIPSNLEMD